MIGDYVLHHPVTDFAVALLVIAAAIELGRIVFKRAHWSIAVDLLLLFGWLGSLAAVATGLWLVAVREEEHARTLEIHHWLAYTTFAVATVAALARLLQRRWPKLAWLKTASLFAAAGLVGAAGYFGGTMAHSEPAEHAAPHAHR